ncbi:MAG: PQQ-dependent sugar dehydrogenase [Phycisphaerae bacterium]|nr:PQQ-dependent sugar dehydrogenase [Phycisphaerae bacterium]
MSDCRFVAALIGIAMTPISIARAQTEVELPDGFEVSEFATGFIEPTALAFAPDGTLFVAERGGTIRAVVDGDVLPDSVAEIEVYTIGEGGLLGLAIDPEFASNGYVYAFASVSAVEQRILRLHIQDNVATDVTVIRGNLPTAGGNHNGGAIDVGPDGMIYFAIGDTGTPELAQELTSLAGKVSRIDREGVTPNDNPFITPTGTPRAVWALGFRNPFRMCFSPDGQLFVGDVGSNDEQRREEIDQVNAGFNYGWPIVEGFSLPGVEVPADYHDPLVAYAEEGASIAGCAVYSGDVFPEEFRGNLFHLDYTSQSLFRVVLGGDEVLSHTLFLKTGGGPVDLIEGPDGALYWVELFSGNVQRLSFPAGEAVPDEGTNGDMGTVTDGGNDDPDNGQPPVGPRLPLCGAGIVAAWGWIAGMLLTVRILPSKKSRQSAHSLSRNGA